MPMLLGRNYQIQELQILWAPLYEAVLNVLGTTGTIMPMVDPHHGQAHSGAFTSVGDQQTTWTPSEPFDDFATPFDNTDPDDYQGIIPFVTFDGIDEQIDTPDITYYTRALAVMSLGAWVNMTDATSSNIMTKYDSAGDDREWIWQFGSDDKQVLDLRDEDDAGTPNAAIKTVADVATSQGVWKFVVATYDGSADASGINLYEDGAVVASTDADDANFSSMRDKDMLTQIGAVNLSAADFFDGKMAGGPMGPFFAQKELSADEVLRLYEVGRRALAL